MRKHWVKRRICSFTQLALNQHFQGLEEGGKRDHRRFGAMDPGISVGTERRHCEGHGDAVVPL